MRLIEALFMALGAIRSNKLRSFLTLVGIVAGVASIIAVMTGISVIQNTMEKELSVLGSTTFQVQKWPAFGGNHDWKKIRKRKPITVENANAVRDRAKNVDIVGAELWEGGSTIKYNGESTNPNITLCGGTPEYQYNNTHYIQLGRNISEEDVRIGKKVAVIGYAVAEKLFPFTDPLDKIIKLDERKFTIIGVFEEKKSSMGGGYDNYCLLPITTFQRFYGMKDSRGRERSVNMTIRAKSSEVLDDAIEEVRAILRVERKVKPYEEDDFSYFTNDSQVKSFNQATAAVKLGAFVIGTIALIVAGIGIMNIMLVSVTERTKEIGIRKSLGAKRKNILMQFLIEAVILCNIGGVIGVLIGFGLGNVMSLVTGFAASVPLEWALGGVAFCSTIGLTFGLWPAVKASKLDPIEALRYE